MKLIQWPVYKIVSDGLPRNTKVIDLLTNEELKGVSAISWSLEAGASVATVQIKLHAVALEVVGEARDDD